MGKRDFGKRETKKQKKDIKKPMSIIVNTPPVTPQVEVVRKKRKHEGEESEEE
jgi:hypothetical protein